MFFNSGWLRVTPGLLCIVKYVAPYSEMFCRDIGPVKL